MVLADTSVWTDHLRHTHQVLARLLEREAVLMHPAVLGEIAMGWLASRRERLAELSSLPTVVVATDREVMEMIDTHGLMGTGMGWIDAHLLASTKLSSVRLLTSDVALKRAASRLGLLYSEG